MLTDPSLCRTNKEDTVASRLFVARLMGELFPLADFPFCSGLPSISPILVLELVAIAVVGASWGGAMTVGNIASHSGKLSVRISAISLILASTACWRCLSRRSLGQLPLGVHPLSFSNDREVCWAAEGHVT